MKQARLGWKFDDQENIKWSPLSHKEAAELFSLKPRYTVQTGTYHTRHYFCYLEDNPTFRQRCIYLARLLKKLYLTLFHNYGKTTYIPNENTTDER